MGYHVVNNGAVFDVQRQSDCGPSSKIGQIYNGEVFTWRAYHKGYVGVSEISFRDSSGQYRGGFITGATYGGLAYYGNPTTFDGVSCYRFKLRSHLQVVSTSGILVTVLSPGDFIYTNSSDCGASNSANMYIIGYTKMSEGTRAYKGFVTLDYTVGSMINSNFCLMKG